MSWLQQQPLFGPWQMQSCPVDNHPERCGKDHFSSSLLRPPRVPIALQYQLPLLHLINHQLFALTFKTLHSLFLPHSPPVWNCEDNSSLVSLPGDKSLHSLPVWFFFIYLFITQAPSYFLPFCFSDLGRVLHKHQWNEIMNLLKLISLKASLLWWWLVEMWY